MGIYSSLKLMADDEVKIVWFSVAVNFFPLSSLKNSLPAFWSLFNFHAFRTSRLHCILSDAHQRSDDDYIGNEIDGSLIFYDLSVNFLWNFLDSLLES